MNMTEQQLRDRYADSDDIYITSYPGAEGDMLPRAIMVYNPMMCDSQLMSKIFLPVISEEWKISVLQKHPFDPANQNTILP